MIYTYLYNIFLNVEAVHRLEKCLSSSGVCVFVVAVVFLFLVGTCLVGFLSALVVSVSSLQFLPNEGGQAWQQGGRLQEKVPC